MVNSGPADGDDRFIATYGGEFPRMVVRVSRHESVGKSVTGVPGVELDRSKTAMKPVMQHQPTLAPMKSIAEELATAPSGNNLRTTNALRESDNGEACTTQQDSHARRGRLQAMLQQHQGSTCTSARVKAADKVERCFRWKSFS